MVDHISGITFTWNFLQNLFFDSYRSVGEIQGEYRDIRNVFKRSLDEITIDSVETVLELINSNTLYRGTEWKVLLVEFKKYKTEYDKLPEEEKRFIYLGEISEKQEPLLVKSEIILLEHYL